MDYIISKITCTISDRISVIMRLFEKRVGPPDKKKGLSVFIETFCSDCNKIVASTYTSSHVNDDERSTFSVNQAAVFGAMCADHSPYENANYCESLNMPSLSKAALRHPA